MSDDEVPQLRELGIAPDGQVCAHPGEAIALSGQVALVVPPGGAEPVRMVDFSATCEACHLPFRFVVPDVGVAWMRPAVNVTGTELNVRIVPLTQDDIETGLTPHLVRAARVGDPEKIYERLAEVLSKPGDHAARGNNPLQGQMEPVPSFLARALMAALPGLTWEGV